MTFSYANTTWMLHEPDSHPDWRFGIPAFDHLVLQNLEDPKDRGHAIPRYAVSELQGNGDGQFGILAYWEHRDFCDYSDTNYTICDSAQWSWRWTGEAWGAITVPGCGQWRLYYVADGKAWLKFCAPCNTDTCAVVTERTFMIEGGQMGIGDCAGIDNDLVGYITTTPNITYNYVDLTLPPCPEPPPLPGQTIARFNKYVKPDGTDGKDWLPSPKDSIGLVFDVTTDPPGLQYDMGYHIWDMSMWKGECMNSPRYDSSTVVGQMDIDPHPYNFQGVVDSLLLDTFRYWDFTVGQPWKYHFIVYDSVSYIGRGPANPWRMPDDTVGHFSDPHVQFPPSRPLYRTDIIAFHRSSAPRDTLWLRCRDYGAHCLVTPEVGGGKDRRMQPYFAPFDQRVWTITVPYDYDGYQDVGVSYGDCMNDKWEAQVCNCTAIQQFRPFVTMLPRRGPADFDDKPVGRDIDGDSWCNFAEYRGVIIRNDSTLQDTSKRHQRLDPLRKSVVIHVRSNMHILGPGDSVLTQMPGYIYKLQVPHLPQYPDTVEIYFTDSIRFRRAASAISDEAMIELRRFTHSGRDINYNRVGSGLWYYGFGMPTTGPMDGDGVIKAETHWAWDRTREPSDLREHHLNPDGILGVTLWVLRPFGTPENGATIPNWTVRTVVQIDKFNAIRDDIYHGDSLHWQQDFPKECKKVIAHEFGHTVGMLHPPEGTTLRTIMNGSVYGPGGFTIADSVFSDSSRDQFSTKEPQ